MNDEVADRVLSSADGQRTLLCLSSCLQGGVGLGVHSLESSVELAGQIALEDSSDLFGGASFCAASFDVGAGFWVVGHAGHDGHVQGAIGSAAPRLR